MSYVQDPTKLYEITVTNHQGDTATFTLDTQINNPQHFNFDQIVGGMIYTQMTFIGYEDD